MSEPTTTQEPGWYPDPAATDQLRFWDGERWTRDVRPTPDAELEADASLVEADLTRSGQRERSYAAVVLGILIAGFAVGGFYEVIAGNSSGNSNPNRFATPDTTTTDASGGSVAPTDPCTAPGHGTDAPHAVQWLAAHGIPATAVSPQPTTTTAPTTTTPASTATTTATQNGSAALCGHVVFTDARTPAPADLWDYATARVAERVVATAAPSRQLVFAVGHYVIRLSSALAPDKPAYVSALNALVAKDAPPTTQPPPVVPGGP